jgi:DNA-binding response OmpR family regulator
MPAKKILIVEDEQVVVSVLTTRLEALGYEIIVAIDGEEALQKTEKEKPDLIILDIMLPKMDGFRVCRILKYDGRYKNIPIIVLTARSQEKDKEVGMDVGADVYITKPYKAEELIDAVEKYLKKD